MKKKSFIGSATGLLNPLLDVEEKEIPPLRGQSRYRLFQYKKAEQ